MGRSFSRTRWTVLVGVVALALAVAGPAVGANVYVTNHSAVPDTELADAMATFQRALDSDFAPIWREARGSKLMFGAAPTGAWEIRLVDQADCWFCDGYHAFDLDTGAPYAVVSAEGDWQVTFSHELWELLVNPYLDRVAVVQPKGRVRVYALEPSDPVESSKFAYVRTSPSGRPIRISDFVTPNWFQSDSGGPWDFTGHTDRPYQLLEEGYQLWLRDGSWDARYARATGRTEGRAKAKVWNARRAKSVDGWSRSSG